MKKILILLLSASSLFSGVTISRRGVDDSNSSSNSSETVLTQTNVAGGTFHKVGYFRMDQVSTATGLMITETINGVSMNLLIVATNAPSGSSGGGASGNEVCAFQADLINSTGNGSVVWCREYGSPQYNGPEPGNWGILGTPAIDPANHAVAFVTSQQTSTPTYAQQIHLLDTRTGADLASPVTLAPTFTGDSGLITLDPARARQRASMALKNGRWYVSIATQQEDIWYGWVIAYDQFTLTQREAITLAPWAGDTCCGGGQINGNSIWMGGAAPGIDDSGNLLVVTGNGGCTAAHGNYGNSILKLSPALAVLDYFQPSICQSLTGCDSDLGSGGIGRVPGTPYWVTVDKGEAQCGFFSNVYVVDSTNMGHTAASAYQQWQPGANPHYNHGVPLVMVNIGGTTRMYTHPSSSPLMAFTWNNSTHLFNTTASLTNSTFTSGGYFFVSGDGTNANSYILWEMTSNSGGILIAYDPATLNILWRSDTAGGDSLGGNSEWLAPIVANGRVYIGNAVGQWQVYSLPLPVVTPISGSVMSGGRAAGVVIQ